MKAIIKEVPDDTIVISDSIKPCAGDIVDVVHTEVDNTETIWYEVVEVSGNYIAHFTPNCLNLLQ